MWLKKTVYKLTEGSYTPVAYFAFPKALENWSWCCCYKHWECCGAWSGIYCLNWLKKFLFGWLVFLFFFFGLLSFWQLREQQSCHSKNVFIPYLSSVLLLCASFCGLLSLRWQNVSFAHSVRQHERTWANQRGSQARQTVKCWRKVMVILAVDICSSVKILPSWKWIRTKWPQIDCLPLVLFQKYNANYLIFSLIIILILLMWSWSLLSCPLQLKVIFYVSFTFRHPVDIFSLSLDVSRCVAERKYTQEQARKEFQQVFIPECNDDGTYSQVNFFYYLACLKNDRVCL